MKSPLLLGCDAPRVHLRLRKRLSRCTLDCGFKTSESPALRGFVGGSQALATAALYLVLLSNGPHRSKIQLIKFGFSPINTPANIAKKLPLQCCSKPLLIPFFNFSHKWPTFAFTGESGYTSAFGEGSHTAAYTPKQGAFRMGVVSLLSERSARSQTSPGRVSAQQTLPLLGLGRVYSRRTQRARGTAMRLCASLFRRRRGPAGLRDLFCFCRNCGLYTLRSGPFRVCEARGGITTLGVLCVLLKRRTAACQNSSFAVF